jgi:hypothetical protein
VNKLTEPEPATDLTTTHPGSHQMTDKGKVKGKSTCAGKGVRFDMLLGGDKNKARTARAFRSERGAVYCSISGMNDQSSEVSGMGEINERGLGGPEYRHGGSSSKDGEGESGIGAIDPEDAKRKAQMSRDGTNSTEAKQPSTKYSRDIVQQRYRRALVKDPQSYSLTTTTIAQQAEAESNFIGSAYFYHMTMRQVSNSKAPQAF